MINYKGYKFTVPKKYATPNILKRFENKTYESDEITLIDLYVKPHNIVLELGACLGITSVITNKILHNNKNHVVVEANTELIDNLIKVKELNKCEYKVENCIVSKVNKKFYIYNKVVAGSAHRQDSRETGRTELIVPCISLPQLSKKHGLLFDTLIIDIEGGEYELIYQHQKYIRENVKLIIVELHGHLMNDKKFNEKCIKLLKILKFKQENNINNVYVFTK
jgi:FkbM family methyltransferase